MEWPCEVNTRLAEFLKAPITPVAVLGNATGSGGSKHLARAQLVDVETGDVFNQFDLGPGRYQIGVRRCVSASVFASDVERCAIGYTDGCVRVFDFVSGRILLEEYMHNDQQVYDIALNREANRIATWTPHGYISFLHTDVGAVVHQVWVGEFGQESEARLAFTPSGDSVVVACEDGVIYLFEFASASDPQQVHLEYDYIASVVFVPGGLNLAVACGECSVCILDLETRTYHEIVTLDYLVVEIAYGPTGETMAVASHGTSRHHMCSKGGHVHLFDPHGRLICQVCLGNVCSLVFDQSGDVLVTSSQSSRSVFLVNAHDAFRCVKLGLEMGSLCHVWTKLSPSLISSAVLCICGSCGALWFERGWICPAY